MCHCGARIFVFECANMAILHPVYIVPVTVKFCGINTFSFIFVDLCIMYHYLKNMEMQQCVHFASLCYMLLSALFVL
jgi:hypothetical protein